MSSTYTVVCDGGKRSGLAYGSYMIFNSKDEPISHHYMIFGFGTSNTAEYLALINAVKECINLGIEHVLIKGDSALILNQIMGNWNTKKPQLKKLRGVARMELSKLKSYTLEKINNKEVKKILGH
jgi:ribonuclease HI